MGKQRTEQRTERRVSRRRFVTGATMALTGASLLAGPDGRALQGKAATPATPLPDTGTPGATPIATPVATGPYLEVTPSAVAFDERFDIYVVGVQPGQRVIITSTFTPWTASATYVAQAIYGDPTFGYVDPAAMIPVEGSFDVADTMAFIWAATTTSSPVYAMTRAGDRETVTITAAIGDVEIGSAAVERSIAGDAASVENVDEDGIVARFYPPAEPTTGSASEPAPAVIVIGGSEGGLSPYNDLTAALLASHGYAALNLAYWRAGDLPPVFENIPLEYFGTAIRWLQRQPSVDPERIAIHGTSRGGEGALLVGSYFPEIKAVVSNVGSGYVVAAPWAASPVPAWTWQGEPLPFLPWTAAATADEVARAEIPVERIDGPVLLIGADADGLWPSSGWSQVALDRLQRHGHPWADQLLRYPGAGHIITMPYQPVAPHFFSFSGQETGGDPHSNATANANSWAATLAMLAARFGH